MRPHPNQFGADVGVVGSAAVLAEGLRDGGLAGDLYAGDAELRDGVHQKMPSLLNIHFESEGPFASEMGPRAQERPGNASWAGESFLGAWAGDGVDEGWARAIAAGETSVRSACFGDSKTKAAAGVPGRGCLPKRRGACGQWRPPLCPSTPWRRGNVITGLFFRIAPQLPFDHAAIRPAIGCPLGVGEVASLIPLSLTRSIVQHPAFAVGADCKQNREVF